MFHRAKETTLKFIQEKIFITAKTILDKNKEGGTRISNFKLYYKMAVINMG